MPDSADIGANASNYQGNAGLGGGSFGSFQLNTKPIEDLAKYTFLWNKSQYDQRQINADEKIKQIAEMTAFDPNNAIDNDKAKAKELYDQLIEDGTEYARNTPKNSSEKVTQYWDYQKKIASTQKAINSIKGRAISYNKRMDDIDKETIPEAQKAVKRKAVIKAANTDIYTPIPLEDKFDEKIPEIAVGAPRKIEVSSTLPNQALSVKMDIVTSSDLLRQAQVEGTGLNTLFSGAHKDFFKASDNEYRIFNDAAQAYNAAIADPGYQKKDPATGAVILDGAGKPVIDYDAIQRANPTLHQVSSLIDDYNNWATDMKDQATKGVFTDRLGKTYATITGVKPEDFFTLDKNQPLNGDQVIMLEKWQKTSNKLLSTTEDLKYTGEANTKLNTVLDYKVAKQNANTASGHLALATKEYDDKVKAGVATANDVGNIIYNVNTDQVKNEAGGNVFMKGTKDPIRIINGVLVDKDGNIFTKESGTFKVPVSAIGNEVITEFNKYAGQSRIMKNETGELVTVPDTKMSRIQSTDGFITVRFKNGEIEGVKTDDGSFAGTDQFKYITNFSSYKGVTKYKPMQDISGGLGPTIPLQQSTIKIPKGATIGKNK